jgi:hypothetical protein
MGFEEWVTEAVKNLSGYFNFGGWRIEVAYKDEDRAAYQGDEYVYAETHVNSTYMTVNIDLYKQAREDFEADNLERLSMGLTHELVHVFLDPFHAFSQPYLSDTTTPFFQDILENQTQKLTMILLKNMPKDVFPPRTMHGKHD